jgi:hypothetical protein
MRRPRIELHIEELVLEGFAPADRHRIGDAVERHLALLLAGPGAHSQLAGGEVARLDAGSFKVARGSTPDAIGARVARAVYGGLSRE